MDATKLLHWWPILVTVAAGILAFGSIRSDTASSVRRIEQLERGTPQLQERVTRIEEQQKTMQRDVSEIKSDVKDIAKAVK